MNLQDIIEIALKLELHERAELIDRLHESLYPRAPEIDRLWQEESVRRLEAHRHGESAGIPMEAIFGKNQPRVLVKATTST